MTGSIVVQRKKKRQWGSGAWLKEDGEGRFDKRKILDGRKKTYLKKN